MNNILAKNLLILASAGSGKTYQLGNRVIGLIGRDDVDPERMVALTFTRKAAGEFADSVLTKLAQRRQVLTWRTCQCKSTSASQRHAHVAALWNAHGNKSAAAHTGVGSAPQSPPAAPKCGVDN